MQAIIKLRPEELTESFFKQLKKMAKNVENVEIRLDGLGNDNFLSEDEISVRLDQLNEGKTISFTKEEFQAYAAKLASSQ